MLGSTPLPFAEPRRFGSALGHPGRMRPRTRADLEFLLPPRPPLPEASPTIAALEAAKDAVEEALHVSFQGDLGSRIAALRLLPSGEDGFIETIEAPAPPNGAPIGMTRAVAPDARMRALADEFYRRQRQASWLFGLGLGGAMLLTLVVFGAIALYSAPTTAETPARGDATASQTVAPGKQASLLIRAGTKPAAILPRQEAMPPSPVSDIVPARAGSVLALGPAIDASDARYVLLRGVPPELKLSAGQATSAGSWILSLEEVQRLTGDLGTLAAGDYALEVYPLGTDGAAPLRQRLVLRVESGQGAQPTDKALYARGERLRAQGDIAGARLIYEYLAERGDAEAAFALATTYDPEMLSLWGTAGITPDRTQAVSWYSRAARTGSPNAGERLKGLASLEN
jgi:hypothetical protein